MPKNVIRTLLAKLGLEVRRLDRASGKQVFDIPDIELYQPLFSPWLGKGEFRDYYEVAAPRSIVTIESCYVLLTLLRQAINIEGDVWECGVYKGGTAAMLAKFLDEKSSEKKLYLFDTFEGMPETDLKRDWHKRGDFSDTDVESVKAYVGFEELCIIKKGFIPDTFAGLESRKVAFAHIDLDIYKSIIDSMEFIWPRLSVGGFVVFDDYGFPSCPGARMAVDEFFASQKAVPLCLQTGQAVVFKSLA